MKPEKKETSIIRATAAEYLSCIAASGKGGIEAVYADENIWLTKKRMATLYDINVRTVNEHLKKIFADSELQENSFIRKFRITATDGKVTAELATARAETEFKKYSITQDRFFVSDFDRLVTALP